MRNNLAIAVRLENQVVSGQKRGESNRMRKFVTLSLVPAAALALGNFVFAQESFFKGKVEGSKNGVVVFDC